MKNVRTLRALQRLAARSAPRGHAVRLFTTGTSAPPTGIPPELEHVPRILLAQPFNQHLGIRLEQLERGRAVLALDGRAGHLQQHHGFVHAGAVATLADNAGGCAAASMLPWEASVVSVEFKINLLEPTRGNRVTATARVLRAGSRLLTTLIEVHAWADGAAGGSPLLTAICTQTIAAVPARPRAAAPPDVAASSAF
jgi:uncharacterized protein (TIGR00369 family)